MSVLIERRINITKLSLLLIINCLLFRLIMRIKIIRKLSILIITGRQGKPEKYKMDVVNNIFGGLQSKTNASVLSALVSASLYIMYFFVNYSATNVPSKLLMPSYDFIVVGGGSAGMLF